MGGNMVAVAGRGRRAARHPLRSPSPPLKGSPRFGSIGGSGGGKGGAAWARKGRQRGAVALAGSVTESLSLSVRSIPASFSLTLQIDDASRTEERRKNRGGEGGRRRGKARATATTLAAITTPTTLCRRLPSAPFGLCLYVCVYACA